jgi:rhodanese-related sulfurtransferase
MELVAAAKQNITEVRPEEALPLLEKVIVVDVREPSEFSTGSLPGAINIPRGVLEFQIGNHPAIKSGTDSKLLIYCQSGGRSALAVESLQKLGYTQSLSLAGGFKLWQESGLPLARP